ncbi:hypothetical protein Hanom_Chr07g00648261 [Helianthus anomalus]
MFDVSSTPPTGLRIIEKVRTVVLAAERHPLKQSNLCRLFSRVNYFTLPWFHPV